MVSMRPLLFAATIFCASLMGLSTRPATAASFTPMIDTFTIAKDGNVIFNDGFSDGAVPTSPIYSVNGPGGMTIENGGLLTMTPALGDPANFGGGNLTRAVRLASVDPNNPNHLGIKNE